MDDLIEDLAWAALLWSAEATDFCLAYDWWKLIRHLIGVSDGNHCHRKMCGLSHPYHTVTQEEEENRQGFHSFGVAVQNSQTKLSKWKQANK